jgi:hypothetical protein
VTNLSKEIVSSINVVVLLTKAVKDSRGGSGDEVLGLIMVFEI